MKKPRPLNSILSIYPLWVFTLALTLNISNGVTVLAAAVDSPAKGATEIRLNQVGYLPETTKLAIVVGLDEPSFQVINEDGTEVVSADLSDSMYWEASGETVRWADFSELSEPGVYQVVVGEQVSYPFEIADNIYVDALVDAAKSYYYHRSGVDLPEDYAGKYARPADTMYDDVKYHPSTGKSKGSRPSKGGWYDAGDYGKYIVNAGVTVGTRLHLVEIYPEILADGTLNIPESGNGVNDLLDELKFEIDWMLTMQDDDGGVFHKVTAKGFEGFKMPHKIKDQRYFIGKSTNASMVFAGTLGHASRLFKEHDEAYAKQLLEAAKAAWQWAVENPDELFTRNPDGVRTGPYNTDELSDEFFWAATELYLITKDEVFQKAVTEYQKPLVHQIEETWRTYYLYLAHYSLANHQPEGIDLNSRQQVLDQAEQQLDKLFGNPYRISIEHFVWGSNSDILNQGMLFQMAHHLSGDAKYLDASVQMVDYLFGKNALGTSFLTGYGDHRVMNLHHRLADADDVPGPIPGFVAGGPNYQMQDKGNLARRGVAYASEKPAKAFIDHVGSYASNEVCINWNAPAVFCLGYLQAVVTKD